MDAAMRWRWPVWAAALGVGALLVAGCANIAATARGKPHTLTVAGPAGQLPHLDKPQEFNRRLDEFLAQLS